MKNINLEQPNSQQTDFKCIICKLPFKDGWDHTLIKTDGSPFLQAIDRPHGEYMHKVEKSGYSLPCFCGGHITMHGTGEDSWETTCDLCNFMWDED